MENELIRSIFRNYELLLPSNPESIILLVQLNDKIEKGEIDEAFSQLDFEKTVDQVAELLGREKSIQKETISKKLSQYFYTTAKRGTEYRYQLTVYAKDLVSAIINEIQPQYDDLPLIYTFRRTLPLTEEDLLNIQNLNYWYYNHYGPAKKRILGHIENLQRYVDKKTFELRSILKADADNARGLIDKFIQVFTDIGKQTEGLTQTLNFKQDTLDRIKTAEPAFLKDKESWERYFKIRAEIEQFFENVDSRVLSINDRIQTSSSRLKTLYDSLRYKQMYKLKIEKYLISLIRSAQLVEGEITLPPEFSRKAVPYFKRKFRFVPKLNFHDVIPKDVPEMHEDEELRMLKEAENMKVLIRQEHISRWLESINTEIKAGGSIEFEDWFKDIWAAEQNLEVPIDVCFGLIQQHNKNPDADLIVEKERTFNLNDDVTIWRMKIQPSNS
jgi:hypothetical protein